MIYDQQHVIYVAWIHRALQTLVPHVLLVLTVLSGNAREMAKIEIYTRLRPTHNRFAGLKTSPSHVSVQVNGISLRVHVETPFRAYVAYSTAIREP